jgi:pyruvate formate lyase activating enzyme
MKKTNVSRREFLLAAAATGCAAGLGCTPSTPPADAAPSAVAATHPARFWKASADRIACQVCPRGCEISPGETGYCRTRRNDGGALVSLVYGRPVTANIDPIEKKPLNHVLPGSTAFSLATVGCNMTCKHCQNWQLSQASPGELREKNWAPEEVVRRAKAAGSPMIAFTYNEPTIWPEYVLDTAAAAKDAGIRTVLISNGFINETPQRELAKALTAYKIDLKGFSEKFYRDICDASLKPVLDGMVRVREAGCWLEIVTLLIPTLNDGEAELKALAAWIKQNLGPDVPLHFTRFHPMFRLRTLPPTPVATLEKARTIAREAGLHFVYTGNVPGHEGAHTYCPGCGTMVIERRGFSVRMTAFSAGKCTACGAALPGVWA